MATFAVRELLRAWMPLQRWFADKGVDFEPIPTGRIQLTDTSNLARLEILLIGRADGVSAYQVPLSYRAAPRPDLDHALIGVLAAPDEEQTWVYDGLRDGAFVAAWLSLIAESASTIARVPTPSDPAPALIATGVRPDDAWPLDANAPATVLSGEQSNTSVIAGVDRPYPLIAKAFRVVAPGPNPDVTIQAALAAAGCTAIAKPAGWLTGTFPSATSPVIHLAYAAEFLVGSEDAWRVAVRAAERGEPFTQAAHDLGQATAQVHALMAAHLPTAPATAQTLEELADGVLDRAQWALRHAPVLAQTVGREHLLSSVANAADIVRESPRGQLQLVHGDFHLGQVLWSDTRGWVLLDFEGEPLRPLTQRMIPDLVQRDLAGMLRSFDYAAGHVIREAADGADANSSATRAAAAQAWADDARHSFLAGYREAGGSVADEDPVLHALELDKALYEVVYETRNRPNWADIPLHAVRRMIRA